MMTIFSGERTRLLQGQNFRNFVMSRFFSTLGTGMSYIIMTWILLENINHPSAVALLMICFWVPTAIVGPFAGILIDRISNQRLLCLSNALRLTVFLLFFIVSGYFNESVISQHIYFLALLQGLLSSLQDPLQSSFVRKLVHDKKLVYANTLLDMIYEFGNIGGMGLAGFVLMALNLHRTLLLLSGLFFISTVLSCLIKKDSPNPMLVHSASATWMKDVFASIQYLKRQPVTAVFYFIQLLILIEFMTAPVILAPYAKNHLHANSSQYGQIEAALSLGLVLGGFCMPWLVRRAQEKWVAIMGAMGCAGIFFLLERHHDIYLTLGLYFLFGLCLMIWPLILTIAQRMTTPHLQGRVSSIFNSLAGMFMVFTYLFIYWFGDVFPIYQLYGLEVLISLTVAFFIWHYRQEMALS